MENKSTKLLQSNIKVTNGCEASGSQIDSFGSSNDGPKDVGARMIVSSSKG